MAAHSQSEKRLRAVLKELREEAGLTQTELGSKVGEPQQVVSKIERGERRLYATQLFEYCKRGFKIGPKEFAERFEKRR